VVDDCVDEASLLCEGLKLNNYDAIAAYTGLECLEICLEGGIDLILLDVGLPDIDGYEVCRRLRENPKTSEVPIIFVTGKGSADDVARGYNLGAVDYIAKPYNLPMVMIRVEAAMRTRQMLDYIGTQFDPLTDTAYTDHLTGLRNRRYLMERLQEEVEKAHRYDYPVSCVVVDVDDVQAVDSELGTVSMDDLLVEIAMAMRNTSRSYDILARFDGALFAAILPHAPLKDALSYANKIQNEITSTTFSDPSFPTQARLSFGVVSCRNSSARCGEHLLGEAMLGLLKAKSRLADDRIFARDLSEDEKST
jgi:diguanylate cyclase (GGDEF)-like protein